ncbi:hypothetical protein bcgnr5378_28550 [Bacillus cereus]
MKIITLLQHYFSTKRNHKRFKSREEMKAYQDRAVESLLKSLPSTNYYFEYNKIINGEGSNYDWRKFPVVDKSFLMDNFDKLNTAGITKEQAFSIAFKAEETRDFSPTINDITIGLSSGTSGNRGIFLVSPEERVKWAGTVLAKLLPSSLFHKQRIAFFLRANSNLYESTNGGRISFSFFDLLEETKILVEKLQAIQPTIVVAPPSMLRILAEAQESGNLHIRPLKLISVAEVLEPLDKKYIETVFSLKLHQVYQCTEGFLGSTCKHGTLHLNEDLVVIEKEFLDDEKRKFSPIITDFSRYAQPIIRYRLNDVLTLKEKPCPCGSVFTAVEQIEGRCDDIFYFPQENGSGVKPVFPDFIRRIIMTSSEYITEYRVIQHSPIHLEIKLKTQNYMDVEEVVRKQFESFLSEIGCETPDLTFTEYSSVTKGTKLKRIEQKWNYGSILP